MASLLQLPDELISDIFTHLDPTVATTLGFVCKRLYKISNEQLLWRSYVLDTWKYWEDEEECAQTPIGDSSSPQWRTLYSKRQHIDQGVLQMFQLLLGKQQWRFSRMECIVDMHGLDAKDVLLKLARQTPDDAPDVLARRYYAKSLLGLLNRLDALRIWSDMQYQDYPRLESCLGAFDLFVQGFYPGGQECGVKQLDKELDSIARNIRTETPDIDNLPYTERATAISTHLRKINLLGSTEDRYYRLRNNFICHVLQSDDKMSMPLISSAIFCCVAQRFSLRIWLCNFPFHVHVVLESPNDPPLYESRARETLHPGTVWMDPWRHDNIIDRETMMAQLRLTGVDLNSTYSYLAPALTRDLVVRTGRNILQCIRDVPDGRADYAEREIDSDAAFYSFLWAMLLVDLDNERQTTDQIRMYLSHLFTQYKQQFPEDVGLVEHFLLPLFTGHPAYDHLEGILGEYRAEDVSPTTEISRADLIRQPKYKVGQPFRHRRFQYIGAVIGWDVNCKAGEAWIEQMGVDTLSGGRHQSFYHIL